MDLQAVHKSLHWLFKAVCIQVVGGFAASEDVGYEGLFTTALDEFHHRCQDIQQPLPAWASGDFIIPSLGQFEMGGQHFVGFMDAFGKLHRFELKDKQVCATYRMMRTGFYNESLKAGTIGRGFLFHETDPPRDCPFGQAVCRVQNAMGPNDNTFVNTMRIGKHGVSLTDSPVGLEFDPKTLDIIGNYQWEDSLTSRKVPYTSSAHPLQHPATGELVDFVGIQNVLTGDATMRLYELKAETPKSRRSLVDIPDGIPPYMHSFGLTSRHVVLPHMPVKFDFTSVLLTGEMTKAFQEISITKTSPDNAFHVMSLAGDGQKFIRTLPASDRLYYTHTVNTYENESGIVIDLSTAPTNPFQRNLTLAFMMDKAARDGDKGARMVVRRFLLPFDGGDIAPVAHSELLSDPLMSTDFLTINPRSAGKKHCFFWSVQWFTDHSSMASMAVMKHELCGQSAERSSLSWSRKNWYPSEPTLLPSPEAGAPEDAGILVFTALDGAKRQTFLILLDAATMEVLSEAGPFPPIGFTTHGEFYAADASGSDSGAVEIPVVV
mmetsp:Transcript_89722/g.178383  ORF Transcript_89722/g.178383 Transcript_89722/m.178383 type:complete len:548 (-) Transcript_89722:47-1690(-)